MENVSNFENDTDIVIKSEKINEDEDEIKQETINKEVRNDQNFFI